MIYAQPGQSIEATLAGAPTGLAGTIGVRVLDNAGGTTTTRVTAGIAEFPAGSGFYTVTLTAPTTAGQYSVFWDTGSVGPTTTTSEDLIVSSTSLIAGTPSGSDLCTLADVRNYLQKQTGDTNQDTVIQSMITHASALISRYTERQFVAETAVTKTFEWEHNGAGHLLSLAPYELRTATTVQIDTDATTPTTLTSDEYRLWPKPAPDGTYLGIRLNPYSSSTVPRWGTRREVAITGNWGLTAVPSDVAHWCIVTVAIWLRRDVAAFETTFNIDEAQVERPQALPSAVKGGLELWKRVSVA